MKFENVKVGDTVAIEMTMSVSRWNVKYYRKSFFIMKEVTRVIKTQFCTSSGKYYKDCGAPVSGTSTGAAYIAGDKTGGFCRSNVKVPSTCQRDELEAHIETCKKISNREHNDSFDILNCKSPSDALLAVELLDKLVSIAPAMRRR